MKFIILSLLFLQPLPNPAEIIYWHRISIYMKIVYKK